MQARKQVTPIRGVPITLDKERRVRYPLGVVRELRDEFGEAALAKGVAPDLLGKLLWYGLKHEDPELTVEDVEQLVDLENLTEIMEAVATATGQRAKVAKFEEALKAAEEAEATDPLEPVPETTEETTPPEERGSESESSGVQPEMSAS